MLPESGVKGDKGASISNVRTRVRKGFREKQTAIKGSCTNLMASIRSECGQGEGLKNQKMLRTSYMKAPQSRHSI